MEEEKNNILGLLDNFIYSLERATISIKTIKKEIELSDSPRAILSSLIEVNQLLPNLLTNLPMNKLMRAVFALGRVQ